MRKVNFILILLTICVFGQAQAQLPDTSVRIIFTSDFQQHPFGGDPVWGGWPDGSMSRAMTYIRSHRRAIGKDSFALIACGSGLPEAYRLYPSDFTPEIISYSGYETAPLFERRGILFQVVEFGKSPDSVSGGADVRIGLFPARDTDLKTIARTRGLDLAVAAFGRDPEVCRVLNAAGDTVTVVNVGTTGKYIGVVDFRSSRDFSVKTVDISGFSVDAEYEDRFRTLAGSVREYYRRPLTELPATIRQSDALFGSSEYASLFHRFQLETSGAEISFFASPLWNDSIPAGSITCRDILRRFRYDNRLCVMELTGAEIIRYLEYTYGLRYNTARSKTDDLFRMSRDRDGVLRSRTPVYHLDDACGIRYEVDVSRPQGRRVRMLGFPDGFRQESGRRYRVAVNSFRAENGGGHLAKGTGIPEAELARRIVWRSGEDYRVLLRDWLLSQENLILGNPGNWRAIPEAFVPRSGD